MLSEKSLIVNHCLIYRNKNYMVDVRSKVAINTSVSKAQFSFPKSKRFGVKAQYTSAISYDLQGQFGHSKGTGANKGFLISSKRFQPQRNNTCQKIDGPGFGTVYDQRGNAFSKTQKFSFGVSRSQMKKIHVDHIMSKTKENEPGPGHYYAFSDFSGLSKVTEK